jgi:hypothetical protein
MSMYRRTVTGYLAGMGFFGALLMAACSDDPASLGQAEDVSPPFYQCSIPQNQILSGGPGKDGIPALSDPFLVGKEHPGAAYLADDDRVIGLMLGSGPVAIPLNLFWWHEIVNLEIGGQALAVSHCPLTGSSLAFDRGGVGGAEFGVTGLLFKNNLIMYDRNTNESLWPQMLRGARCGALDGQGLIMVPIIEMNWEGWRTLYPQTQVASDVTEYERDYTVYPYSDYDKIDNSNTFFPAKIDERRPAKERVLGVTSEAGGLAFPFGLLGEEGPVAAVAAELPEGRVVVFWDQFSESAMAFSPDLDDEILTFSVANERITDDQTGSLWRIDGLAVEGPLADQQLQPWAEAFVAFWFAWPEFYPDIRIWNAIKEDR